MIGKKILDEKTITMAEAKELLEKLIKEKKIQEVSYVTKQTLDYLKKFIRISAEDAKKMLEELLKLDKINERIAIKIVDLMPRTPEEVRAIYAKEIYILTKEDVEKILNIVYKYLR